MVTLCLRRLRFRIATVSFPRQSEPHRRAKTISAENRSVRCVSLGSRARARQLISIITAEAGGAACDRAGEGRERG